jgi:hypothetical protein
MTEEVCCYTMYPGSLIRLTGQFYDQQKVLTDPSVVSLLVRTPSGVVSDPLTPTKDSTGIYHYDYTVAEGGTYWYRFIGTGAVVVAREKAFEVEWSHFAT